MSPDEFDQLLHDTEVKLARLRALYEQYFQGIEKLEPTVARKDMDRSMEFLKKNLPRNTALRFRTQQLSARYGTYLTYWQRITREIEEGTYKRDVLRASKLRGRPHAKAKNAPTQEIELDVDVDAIEDDQLDDRDIDAILGALGGAPAAPASRSTPEPPSASTAKRAGLSAFAPLGAAPPPPGTLASRPAPAAPAARAPASSATGTGPSLAPPRPPPPPAPRTPFGPPGSAPRAAAPPAPPPASAKPAPPKPAPSPPAAPARATEGRALEDLYARYSEARRKNNEGAVRFETLKDSVDKMMPKLREKYGDKRVDFEIVMQNGRVGLKPKVDG